MLVANLNDMHPVLFKRYQVFDSLMKAANIDYQVNAVLRTVAMQEAYYAQGRQALVAVNMLRKAAGMSPIGNDDNSYTVTNTHNSRHFPDAHGKSRAFDIVLLKPGRVATWDTKWDADHDSIPEYEEAAKLGEKAILVAGGHWKGTFHDWPHFELPADVV
jgi:hypothetical protein